MAAKGCILAIETSQRDGAIALQTSRGDVLVESLRQSDRHDDDLLPAIDRVVKRAGLRPDELEAVGVSIGPGGFTGLRIAVATTKMLAEALGVKLLAVPSALVAAESYEGEAKTMVVALATKHATCWAARLERPGGPLSAWGLTNGGGIVRESTMDLRDIGAVLGDTHVPTWLRDMCAGASVALVEPRFDAMACLRCAERMLAAGEVTDPLQLLPLYPREPEAVTVWNERAAAENHGVQ